MSSRHPPKTFTGQLQRPHMYRREFLAFASTAGIGTMAGCLDRFQNDVLWTFEPRRPFRRSSPSIVDGVVYIGRYRKVYAIDADEGERRWEFKPDSGVSSSPNVVDGTVYIGSDDGNVYALATDPEWEEGSHTANDERWRFETGDRVSSSPTVVEGAVYVGSRDSHVYALDAADGQRNWGFETGGKVFSSPTIFDGTLYVTSADSHLYALDAEDGELLWKVDTGQEIRSSPTVSNDTLYVGGGYDPYTPGTVYALNATTGDLQWEFGTIGADLTPTVADGMMFIGSQNGRDGKMYGLDAGTGDMSWEVEFERSYLSSPTVVEGTTFYARGRNVIGVDPQSGEEVWRYDAQRGLFYDSSPTVHDGVLYIGGSGVKALDVPVDGSSEGSRVSLGTYGHHDGWTGEMPSG